MLTLSCLPISVVTMPPHAPLQLGMKKALVVHSMGLDELTPMGPADVVEVSPAGIKSYRLDPLSVGIPRWGLQGAGKLDEAAIRAC